MIPGPRYLAAGPEITTVGGLGDSAPSHIPHEGLNLGIVVSGPEEVRRTVRTLDQIRRRHDQAQSLRRRDHRHGRRRNADVRGRGRDGGARGEAPQQVACRPTRARRARSSNACVTASAVIYHASFADEEALDMLEAAKDRHFVAPGLAWLINTARNAGEYGIKPGSPITMQIRARARTCCRNLPQDASARHSRADRRRLRLRLDAAGHQRQGPRIFRRSCSASRRWRRILAATKPRRRDHGHGQRTRQIKPGYLADMLLVDGDPAANVRVLQDKSRLLAIMKDGEFHKAPRMNEQRRRLTA